MVAGNDLGIGRRDTTAVGAALSGARDAVLLLSLGLVLGLGAVVHAALGPGLLLLAVAAGAVGRLDVHVGDAAALAVVGQGFVLVRRLGELGDDVPGVEEAGDEAQAAEEDVDDGVGAADAALDPDCIREGLVSMYSPGSRRCRRRRRSRGLQSALWRGWCDKFTGRQYVPGSGGKRMANRPRKMSAEHMAWGRL